MIVRQIGYLKVNNILEMISKGEKFSIYKTRKNTCVLVKGANSKTIHLYYPKKDRLPYKDVEGKKIISGQKVFDSESTNDILNNTNWNNGNQIMAYEEFVLTYYFVT